MSIRKVLFIASELTPLAKVGGLADVVGALPKALAALGIDVRIAIPKYGVIDDKKYATKKIASGITVPFNGKKELVTVFETALPSSTVPVYLIENKRYLGENGIYFETLQLADSAQREIERFTFFARSSLAMFPALSWKPDIIHCHDWHVGILPLLMKLLAKTDSLYRSIKTLFTIHNLEFQGLFDSRIVMEGLGISTKDCPSLLMRNDGKINLVQQAIAASDFINAVSPTYRNEILTPEFGAGLEKDLQGREHELAGILNGIDADRFNPATDPYIVKNFSADDLAGKRQCKLHVQKRCGLPERDDIPLIGIVSRITDQKGFDLVYDAIKTTLHNNTQLAILGTGDPKLEELMESLESKHPHNVSSNIEFNAALAQQIYAGSDIFLMPSRFEPCGLGQMIAMRYGTVPVVRATGGLRDSVADYNNASGAGDGFVFEEYKSSALKKALQRALTLYRDEKAWYTLVVRLMKKDFSWNNSARQYAALYNRLIIDSHGKKNSSTDNG
ncbi:MAG: glycogen/starch synthase [Patescibacteria group bacterium]|nr:glycogen/starch synthase [Patescibacteria group bacterium]MDD5715970.1 glycogen/starch synthase [Patescibacteria group bacterium]